MAVAETERRLGPIDVLVVNHGIGSAHEKLVWEQDPAVWRETMRINLDGPFELARLTLGGMCKRGFGRLVFTSSTAGEKAERCGSAYSASKHGLIGLARAVAQDAGPFGVTSNAVLPGWVRTEMAERLREDGSRKAQYQCRTGVARTRRSVPAEPGAGAARGRAGDCVSLQRRGRWRERRGRYGRAGRPLVGLTAGGDAAGGRPRRIQVRQALLTAKDNNRRSRLPSRSLYSGAASPTRGVVHMASKQSGGSQSIGRIQSFGTRRLGQFCQ